MPGKLVCLLLLLGPYALGRDRVHGRPVPRPVPLTITSEILGGLSFAYGAADPSRPGATRNTFALLAAAETGLGGRWTLSGGLGYVGRGVQTTLATIGTFDLKGTIKMDYLEAFVLLKRRFPLSRRLNLVVLAGPAAALVLRREVEVLGTLDVDLSGRFATSDTLLHVGAGVEYRTRAGWSVLGQLRYALGLGDIDRTPNQFRTRGILLLVGIGF